MGRIEEKLSGLRKENKKALVFFLTAGFPKRDSTEELAAVLELGGADILEIGMPFSDPLADGPAIQESSSVAIKNGVTLQTILDSVRAIRKKSDIPLVLMGYLNPILRFGEAKFFAKAADVGVDGIILPELPFEETDRFRSLIDGHGLSQILLVTPTTAPDRIRTIDAASRGFLYCVSTTGVTGSGHQADMNSYLATLRKHAQKNPLLVGFGISTPQDAASIAASADGVIIGSALIRRISGTANYDNLAAWTQEFRTSLDSLR